MSIFRRLRLDEVITSLPELGPTIPDGGYSWIVLFGIMIVQVKLFTSFLEMKKENQITSNRILSSNKILFLF